MVQDAVAPPKKWVRWKKITLWAVILFLAGGIFICGNAIRLLVVGVPMAYHKRWAFQSIREYHEKMRTWPKSWDEIERILDPTSTHKFTDIKKTVSVKWENLGVVITDPNDYYIRTDPDVKWQGEDWNRDMILLIQADKHRPAK